MGIAVMLYFIESAPPEMKNVGQGKSIGQITTCRIDYVIFKISNKQDQTLQETVDTTRAFYTIFDNIFRDLGTSHVVGFAQGINSPKMLVWITVSMFVGAVVIVDVQ